MAGNANYETALLTMTLEKFLHKKAADAIFEDLALFEFLNAKGRVKRDLDGGKNIVTPLMYGKSTAVGSYSGYDLLDVSPQEGFTNAEYEWKQYYATVAISGEEEEKNAGEMAMLNLLDNKWMQARLSLRDKLNTDSFLDGTGNGSKNITGLALMVDSAGNYGNIARASNSWWAAQETAVSGALTIEGSTGMRRMYNDCALGKGKMTPDFILCEQEAFEAYEALMAPYLRYTTGSEGNAVFSNDNLRFRKATLFWDEACTSQTMYFLNTNVITLAMRRDFRVEPFQKPINQDAKIAKILWMGQLCASNCRHLGKLTGITNS